MKETAILHRVMLALTGIGARLLRNNIGSAWMGESKRIQTAGMIHVEPGDVVVRRARFVEFGVGGPGGSDLVGWMPYTVRSSDIGRQLALFAAVETKQPGKKPTSDQHNFLSSVEAAGGVAVVAYEADSAVAEVMRKTHL